MPKLFNAHTAAIFVGASEDAHEVCIKPGESGEVSDKQLQALADSDGGKALLDGGLLTKGAPSAAPAAKAEPEPDPESAADEAPPAKGRGKSAKG